MSCQSLVGPFLSFSAHAHERGAQIVPAHPADLCRAQPFAYAASVGRAARKIYFTTFHGRFELRLVARYSHCNPALVTS